MGSFCKMGSLFLENGFAFLQKMGSNLTNGRKNSLIDTYLMI